MKIMVLSAVHLEGGTRHDIYRFFCKRMEGVRSAAGIETLIVGTTGDGAGDVAAKHGHHFIEHQNKPLSYKFNAGLQAIREHNPDYVMILGSDDIASDSLFHAYKALTLQHEYGVIGVHDLYFMGLHDKRWGFGYCGYWKGRKQSYMLGVGRMIHKRILDYCDWNLWYDARNSGLDGAASKTIKNAKQAGVNADSITIGIKKHNHLLIDIKTRGNISSMSNFEMEDVEYDRLFFDHVSPDEAGPIVFHIDKTIYGKY